MLHHTLGDLKLGAEEQVCLPNRDWHFFLKSLMYENRFFPFFFFRVCSLSLSLRTVCVCV
jgi:hypothetical protein